MKSTRPKLSFGLPVYNAEDTIGRAVESILAQTFTDLELVISDNASTDRTAEICCDWARQDARVRLFRNDLNIGLLPNFDRVFELAHGEYFRWIGSDDWLEPEYASACVPVLDSNPDAIAVSTYQENWENEIRD